MTHPTIRLSTSSASDTLRVPSIDTRTPRTLFADNPGDSGDYLTVVRSDILYLLEKKPDSLITSQNARLARLKALTAARDEECEFDAKEKKEESQADSAVPFIRKLAACLTSFLPSAADDHARSTSLLDPLLPPEPRVPSASKDQQLDILDGRVNPDFRLLKRNMSEHQTDSKFNVIRESTFSRLLQRDRFHAIIMLPTLQFYPSLVAIFVLSFTIFALGYMWFAITWQCELGIVNFVDAFLFSLETQMTIGYGAPDPEFKDCRVIGMVVVCQSMTGMIMQGALIGIMYTRMSSAKDRACTVAFSDKACIREVNGKLCFTFQVCEVSATQLLGCQMRCYVFRHGYHSVGSGSGEKTSDIREKTSGIREKTGVFFQQFSMRLLEPDDGMGAPMLLAFPQTCIHQIDAWSPLVPPWYNESAFSRAEGLYGNQEFIGKRRAVTPIHKRMAVKYQTVAKKEVDCMIRTAFPLPPQRDADCKVGSLSAHACFVCGSQFPTRELLGCHLQFSAKSEELAKQDMGHVGLLKLHLAEEVRYEGEHFKHEVKTYIDLRWLEVVCLLEGVEASTSATLQAKHSYTVKDIEWDRAFVPCVDLTPDGGAKVNFSRFHQTVPVVRV
eukprot:GEMP01026063.1.p1 GENE.GEMP01026063.1~~GEMP01026063.1.p1  ORF type:complete len:613 (+),score=92.57 GEMP01026063.1:74-1912(+)